MYGKFFASTFTGSMFGAGSDVFAVWGYVIANAGIDGRLELNPKMLASVLGASVDAVERAIVSLCEPDPHSRNPQADGRRLQREGQYQYRVTSHEIYRAIRNEEERRAYNREKQRESRARRIAVKRNVNDKSNCVPPSAHTEVEAEVEVDRTGEDQASSCDSECTKSTPPSMSPPASPKPSRPSSLQGSGVMAGTLPRAHRTHAWCAFVDGRYRGVCVPDSLHAQFIGQHGGDPDEADTILKTWYETVVRAIPVDQPIGDDVFTFWRCHFTAPFGSIAPPPMPEPAGLAVSMVSTNRR